MIFRNFKSAPERMVPAAMALVVVGLSIVMIGVNLPRFSAPLPPGGTDWNDFVRGAIFGFGIVVEICGVVLAARAAAAKKRNAS